MTNLLNSTPLNAANSSVKQFCFSMIKVASILRNKKLWCWRILDFSSDGITIAKLNGPSKRISSMEGRYLLKSNITDVLTVTDLLLYLLIYLSGGRALVKITRFNFLICRYIFSNMNNINLNIFWIDFGIYKFERKFNKYCGDKGLRDLQKYEKVCPWI